MSPDPGGVKVVHLDDPQTWNMYAYVRNNPTTLTDPTGLYLLSPEESTNIDSGEGLNYVNEWDKPSSEGQEKSAPPQEGPAGQDPPKKDLKPPSWKPDQPLPDDPSKLGPDWKKNPDHKDPNGEEYVNVKTGEKLEWNKGRSGSWGPKADRGKDGWHYTPPGGVRGKQVDPGQVLKAASKVGFWATVVVVTIKIIEAAGEACAEGGCW